MKTNFKTYLNEKQPWWMVVLAVVVCISGPFVFDPLIHGRDVVFNLVLIFIFPIAAVACWLVVGILRMREKIVRMRENMIIEEHARLAMLKHIKERERERNFGFK